MTKNLATVSFKLPASDLRRIPARNRSEFYRDAVREKLERQAAKSNWKPTTVAAKKMAALRARYISGGGELLDTDGIATEIRERRGGLA